MWRNNMVLTQKDIDEVYRTVEIEMLGTFEMLSYLYKKPGQKEKAQLMAEIEAHIRKTLGFFKLPQSVPNSATQLFDKTYIHKNRNFFNMPG